MINWNKKSQIFGVAMGFTISTIAANLVMEYVEKNILLSSDLKPSFSKLLCAVM